MELLLLELVTAGGDVGDCVIDDVGDDVVVGVDG